MSALFFGQALDQMGQNANIWPKMTKNAYFGPNLAVFGLKILICTGASKSFGNHIMKKPPGQLVRIVFWSAWEQIGQNADIWQKKCQFWAKFGCFWAKYPIFLGEGVKLLVPSYQETS